MAALLKEPVPIVSVDSPSMLITRSAVPKVTAPVPRFRSFEPPKVKVLTVTGLLVESVKALPLVLSSVPAVRVSVPVPSAEA